MSKEQKKCGCICHEDGLFKVRSCEHCHPSTPTESKPFVIETEEDVKKVVDNLLKMASPTKPDPTMCEGCQTIGVGTSNHMSNCPIKDRKPDHKKECCRGGAHFPMRCYCLCSCSKPDTEEWEKVIDNNSYSLFFDGEDLKKEELKSFIRQEKEKSYQDSRREALREWINTAKEEVKLARHYAYSEIRNRISNFLGSKRKGTERIPEFYETGIMNILNSEMDDEKPKLKEKLNMK